MPRQSDPLVAALEKLELAVGSHVSDASIDRALQSVEEAINRHVAGPFTGVDEADRSVAQSPGMYRQRTGLRDELTDILAEARSLREIAHTVAQNNYEGAGQAVAGVMVAPTVNLAKFHDRARRLAQSLRRYEEKEVALVQESYNTDIGAGD